MPFREDIGDAAKLQGFWGGTLGKAPTKQYELVKNGVADVTWVLPGYTAGQFPQMGVFELPFLFHNGVEASIVGWKLHEKGLLDGLEDVHLVGFFASEPNALLHAQADRQIWAILPTRRSVPPARFRQSGWRC